ncbi:MAG: Ornithine carbamoyltransferase [Thermoproteota archaeon]|nr:Ornithine carbamoyltransferase [Thermoproteota archaeon]
MQGRDFLTLSDVSAKELREILDFSIKLKEIKYSEELKGKTLAMLFAKTSTRTRVSFETAMTQLNGHAINLNWNETNFVKGDLKDEAKILGLYCDAVMARVFTHDQILSIAEGCDKPVINGMDDLHHPCQALADLLTILETKGKFKGLKLGWVGDGTNVCNSLIQGAEMVGMKAVIATPKGYEPKVKTSATIIQDPKEAARGADILVTDTWISLGFEKEKEERMRVFPPYQLNTQLLALAKKDCIVLHCLPAQRGHEITSDVMDSPQSKIFQESENRLHTEKALLLKLI